MAVDTGIKSKEIHLRVKGDLDETIKDPIDTPDNGLESTQSEFKIRDARPKTERDEKSTEY